MEYTLQQSEPSDIKSLFSFEYDSSTVPSHDELAALWYILANTPRENVHRMRGETENRVFTNQNGKEAVFDKNDKLVTNSYNKGGYNFFPVETEPIKNFIYDITPWLRNGNCKEDPTSFHERLYYYTLDLDTGIQKYIFAGSEELSALVNFNTISAAEKETYAMFSTLIFNPRYAITIKRETLPRLRKDADYYYEYFYQIQELLTVKQTP
ncbi:MAG: hypothetical protein LBC72_04470 [Spirochaetaceae bacterium]|jgi:hypothetical protein|nr:hypothetical protein [Spirochaetaceae bacterium]